MEAKGLKPSAPADRRTLIRRAYLDLSACRRRRTRSRRSSTTSPRTRGRRSSIGCSRRRITASAGRGTGWIWSATPTRAASSSTTDRPQAWRYRDYVIDAFNDDKPYDRSSASRSPATSSTPVSDEAMIATGFLRLGPDTTAGRTTRMDAAGRLLEHDVADVPRPDGRLRALPRSQVRSDSAEGLLPAAGGLLLDAAGRASAGPAREVEANRRDDAAHRRLQGRCARPSASSKRRICSRSSIARSRSCPSTCSWRGSTPPEKRTEGQKLNVDPDREDARTTRYARSSPRRSRRADARRTRRRSTRSVEGRSRRSRRSGRSRSRRRWRSASGAAKPQPSYFLHRGSPDAPRLADDAGRACRSRVETEWEFPEPPPTRRPAGAGAGSPSGSRRRSNPLTARVMVNRIWQHHFGEGIVRTPSNFGKMGERPSHPELLDWLALEFVRRGWSMKAMHRLMMTSRAYQMASDRHRGQRRDRSREPVCSGAWPRQRLEAEIIRDEILAVAGNARPHGRRAVRCSRTSIRICSRRARSAPGPASRTTTRRRGGAASTSSPSAASAIRCSRRSISPNLMNSVRPPQSHDHRAAGAAS